MRQERPDFLILLIVYGATNGLGLLLGLSFGQSLDHFPAQAPQAALADSLWLKLTLMLLLLISALFARAEYEFALFGQQHRVQRVPPPRWHDLAGICTSLAVAGQAGALSELTASSAKLDLALEGSDFGEVLRRFTAAKAKAYRLLGGEVPAQVQASLNAKEGETA